MKKKLIVVLLSVFSFYGLFAQTVKGKVINSSSEKPMTNVRLSVLGTTITGTTSANGTFLLKNVPTGKQIITIDFTGYEKQSFPLSITKKGVDLGTIRLYESMQQEADLSTITLTDVELDDDEGSADNTAGILQSSKDVFTRAAAFNFPWFRARGYDSENADVLINGIKMNKVSNGRPQWSDWGGLNDVLRNQEFANGLAVSEQTFGGVLGSTSINTRASEQRAGTRISAASANRNYSGRAMVTHNTGMNEKGWALSVSASRRYATEGYNEGSTYNAWSGFIAAERKINDAHSINLTAFHTFNRRGKSSPGTQEAYDLRGTKYNSYWGKQNNQNRNSRMKEISEPVVILSHYWDLNSETIINTNISFQTGHIGNSRIGYYKAKNPDPTYYKNMPSFHVGVHDDFAAAYKAEKDFQNYGQVDWDGIYKKNETPDAYGNYAYYLYEDRNDDTTININTNITTDLTDNIALNGRVNYASLKSENYANMLDLLGSKYHLDIDGYAQHDTPEEQYNLANPDRKIMVGDRFNYNYKINSSYAEAFAQLQFAYNKVDFFVSGEFVNTNHQREGLYKNGTYQDNSLGKGEQQTFNDISFKGGLTYKVTGRHLLNANVGMLSVAPNLRGTFFNSRVNNIITPDITSQKITSFDASYIYRAPGVKARLTGYMTNFENGVETAFYYAEGIIFEDPNESNTNNGSNDFVGETTTGVNKQNIGVEFGMEVQATPTIKITGVVSVADFKYTSNPYVYLTDENHNTGVLEYGTAYLNGYHTGGTAEKAYSLGFEYRDPNYWWFGVNANYIADKYINITKLIRTDAFYQDAENDNQLYINPKTGNQVTQQDVDALLTQEKFDPAFLVNAVGGKSWKIGDKYIGVFANISNILGRDYKTGGFEQARKANFLALQEDKDLETPIFGSKYWFGNKTTYYLNLYLRF